MPGRLRLLTAGAAACAAAARAAALPGRTTLWLVGALGVGAAVVTSTMDTLGTGATLVAAAGAPLAVFLAAVVRWSLLGLVAVPAAVPLAFACLVLPISPSA